MDGARGVAVAGVLLFHGGHLLGGYLGVDLFFTLSGFLITSLLLAESARTDAVSLGGFWARRARRLLPALALLLVGIGIYCVAFASPDELAQIRGDALATLGYVANWRQIFSHQDYFALFRSPSPLNHTWSLAIEEQFYVIWPLVFVGLLAWRKRATPKAVLVTALALTVVSTTLMIGLGDDTTRAYFGTDTRATAILLGIALAAWLAIHGPTEGRNRRIALEVAACIAVLGLAIAWTRLDGQSSTLYHGGFLAIGVAATVILAAITHPQPGLLSRALSWKPLCALGLISYGVYLYHWPIDVAFDAKQMGFNGWPLFAFQTALTLVVSYASYRLVEQPIRHGKLTKIQWQRLTPAVAVGLVGLIFLTTAGAKPPKRATILRHPLLAATKAAKAAAPGATRIMIVGNSVADSLAPGFAKLHTDPPLAVFNASIPGCYFPPELTGMKLSAPNGIVDSQFPCDPSWEPGAITRFKPDIVFWIVSNPSGTGGTYRGQRIERCSAAYDALYESRLEREVKILAAGGAKIVIPTEAYSRYYGAKNTDRLVDCDNAVRKRAATATGAQLIDLLTYVCPGGECRVKDGGVTLRSDGIHYSERGATVVARWLMDHLGTAGSG